MRPEGNSSYILFGSTSSTTYWFEGLDTSGSNFSMKVRLTEVYGYPGTFSKEITLSHNTPGNSYKMLVKYGGEF